MKCPFCNSPDTQVIDSRVSDNGDSIRRRRKCAACNKRFTTWSSLRSSRIGQMVMRELRRLDQVAYIRFASVYRSFEGVDDFQDAIKEVQRPSKEK